MRWFELPSAKWRPGDVVRTSLGRHHRVVLVLSRNASGEFEVVNGDADTTVHSDTYTVVHQAGSQYADGSLVMPGTVAVINREELDGHGLPWKLDGEPVQHITDSDEYRRRRCEWENGDEWENHL